MPPETTISTAGAERATLFPLTPDMLRRLFEEDDMRSRQQAQGKDRSSSER